MVEPILKLVNVVPYLLIAISIATLSIAKEEYQRKLWVVSNYILILSMYVVFFLFMLGDDIGIAIFSDDIRTTGYSFFFGGLIIQMLITLSKKENIRI